MRGAVDIAGQHEHVSLFDPALHRALLDRYGRLEEQLAAYGRDYAAVADVVSRMEALGGDESRLRERAEFLRFQLDEIPVWSRSRVRTCGWTPSGGGWRAPRSSSDRAPRRSCCCRGEESSAVEKVGRALGLVNEAAKFDATLAPVAEALARGPRRAGGGAARLSATWGTRVRPGAAGRGG